jgi:sterol 3beta-glucosyltransferase
MNILILTFGSRGDVQPYVALGKGLKARSHTVTICTCGRFSAFVAEHGLKYAHADDGFLELMDSVEGRAAMEDANSIFGTLKTMRRLWSRAKPIMRQMLRDSWDAALGAEPDIIIYHPKGIGAVAIAEKLGIQVILAIPFPMLVPTAETPSIGLPNWRLGAWYNRATYKLVHKVSLWMVGKPTKEWRIAHKLSPQICGADILHTPAGDPIPVLHGYSPEVSPRPRDWPNTAYITGYWFLDRLDDWKPSKALRDFLDAGDAPVYVGFGSMSGRDPRRLTGIVIEALLKANVRGILSTGWGGLQADALPDSIFKIDNAPHDWLFPQVSAVVHHGGAGTTAAGLRSGRPTIICPFFGDQGYWGNRVRALGVGPAPLPQKKLTAEKLARALRTVVSDEAMRERAGSLGERIRGEDGLSNAVAIIEGTYGAAREN